MYTKPLKGVKALFIKDEMVGGRADMSIFVGPENIQYRIRKNQSRARNVGITYWIATILLFVFSVFPCVGGITGYAEDGHLWIVSCFAPILELSSGQMTRTVLVNLIASVLYLCMFFFTICNFAIATTRLFRITKKNPTNKLGYNRASKGTKTMGKAYGRMFFWMLTSAVVALLLSDGEFTLFFYIAFILALIFHFICNFSACKISYFQSTDDRFRPIERIRTESRVVCLLRNAWQFVSIIMITIFMDKFGLRLGSLFDIVDPNKAATLMSNNLLDGVVLPALLFVILLCLIVCIRHATGVTEYNEFGTKGRGMKTCRIFAAMIAVFAILGELVVLIVPKDTVVSKWAFLAIFTVAVQWIVAENMFLELSKKKEELEEESRKFLEEAEKLKAEKEAKLAAKTAKSEEKKTKTTVTETTTDQVNSTKKVKKTKKEKRRLEKERMHKLLSEVDLSPADPFGEFEEEESMLRDRLEGSISDEQTSRIACEPVVKTTEVVKPTEVAKPVETTVRTETAAVAATVTVAATDKGAEAPVTEESATKPLTFPDRNQIEALALKKKWMALADKTVANAPKMNIKGKEVVCCPHCKKKLSVKLDAAAVQCPACKTKFRLKRKEAGRLAEYAPADKGFDMQAYIERMRAVQAQNEAHYLAEAEEELRRLMESDEI